MLRSLQQWVKILQEHPIVISTANVPVSFSYYPKVADAAVIHMANSEVIRATDNVFATSAYNVLSQEGKGGKKFRFEMLQYQSISFVDHLMLILVSGLKKFLWEMMKRNKWSYANNPYIAIEGPTYPWLFDKRILQSSYAVQSFIGFAYYMRGISYNASTQIEYSSSKEVYGITFYYTPMPYKFQPWTIADMVQQTEEEFVESLILELIAVSRPMMLKSALDLVSDYILNANRWGDLEYNMYILAQTDLMLHFNKYTPYIYTHLMPYLPEWMLDIKTPDDALFDYRKVGLKIVEVTNHTYGNIALQEVYERESIYTAPKIFINMTGHMFRHNLFVPIQAINKSMIVAGE